MRIHPDGGTLRCIISESLGKLSFKRTLLWVIGSSNVHLIIAQSKSRILFFIKIIYLRIMPKSFAFYGNFWRNIVKYQGFPEGIAILGDWNEDFCTMGIWIESLESMMGHLLGSIEFFFFCFGLFGIFVFTHVGCGENIWGDSNLCISIYGIPTFVLIFISGFSTFILILWLDSTFILNFYLWDFNLYFDFYLWDFNLC